MGKTKRVASNESADIVRMLAMLSGSFDESRLEEINTLDFRIYHEVNNGAYKAGFSSNQETHEKACATYFRALDWLNTKLANSRYLITNDAPTEVDLRLFPTIYRHDPVYHSRMKLNVAMVRDYVHLDRGRCVVPLPNQDRRHRLCAACVHETDNLFGGE